MTSQTLQSPWRRVVAQIVVAAAAIGHEMTFIEHLEELRKRILWAVVFISPGLHRHERRYAIPFVLSASLLFIIGGVFGYFVVFPTALRFLLDWIVESKLTPIIDAVEYFDLFFSIMVALGIVFQIPAVIFVLSSLSRIRGS